MLKVCEAERWNKSRSTKRPCLSDARGRRVGINDEAPVAIRVCSYGYRHIVTQILVNREPCYESRKALEKPKTDRRHRTKNVNASERIILV